MKKLLLFLCLVCAGCSDSTSQEQSRSLEAVVDGGEQGERRVEANEPLRTLGCRQGTLSAGRHNVALRHNDLERTAWVFVPKNYRRTVPTSLVLNFHGFPSNGAQQELFSKMDLEADKSGFVVAYPNGVNNAWNAGKCCGPQEKPTDDVGYVRALVKELSAKLCLNPRRVYAVGMSNGGSISYRLACEAADLIAAIAPVSGVMVLPTEQCKPSRPISVIHFHGAKDQSVPVDGDTLHPSLKDNINFWVKHNGCDPKPKKTFEKGETTCETYGACQGGVRVTLCVSQDMAHCWPGQQFCPSGSTSKDVDGNVKIWEFLQQFSLP